MQGQWCRDTLDWQLRESFFEEGNFELRTGGGGGRKDLPIRGNSGFRGRWGDEGQKAAVSGAGLGGKGQGWRRSRAR